MNNSDADFSNIEAREQVLYEAMFINEDLKVSSDDLKKFVEECGGQWNALELETLEHFKCRFVEKWRLPSARAALVVQTCKQSDETIPAYPVMIIPADTSIPRANYIAQLTCPINSLSDKERENIKDKMHIGKNKTLFNADALTSSATVIPVVESPDSAMSIWQATRGTVPAVALANFDIRADTEKLTTAIKEIQPVGKRFLLLLDGNSTGRITAGNLAVDLFKIYTTAAARYMEDFLDTEDKKFCVDSEGNITANSILRVKGNEFLKDLIACIVADAEKDFIRAEKEIAETQAEAERVALTTEQYNYLFSDVTGLTDKDFAQRMIYIFGDRVRWMTDDLLWLIRADNKFGGAVWKKTRGEKKCLYPLAYNLSDRLEAHANKTRETDKKIATAFKSEKKISATITIMQGAPSILITAQDIDRNPELLNCLNGVINLESGEFYPTVDPSLIFTKQANAVYRGKDFHSAIVDNFLSGIQPNAETRAAILRYLGYSCAGRIRDHIFQIWRGDGRNGKSSLLALTAETLGTYCVTLAKSAVLDNGKTDDPNAPTPALSVLEGARLAIVPELPRTARINTVLMKHLCGGDALPIRRLHCEQRTIKPVAKYILNGNFNPSVDDVNDLGLNERIRNVPFNQTFTGEQADPRLPEKLSTDEARSAMLSILVTEAQNWYRDGLLESAEMVTAKDAYIAANDFIGEFVSENCEYGGGFIDLKDFIEAIKENSDEARKTPERILKDMVKKWLDGKNGVTYKKHPRTRRYGFSEIHWTI